MSSILQSSLLKCPHEAVFDGKDSFFSLYLLNSRSSTLTGFPAGTINGLLLPLSSVCVCLVRQRSPFSPVKGSAFNPTSHREDGVKSGPPRKWFYALHTCEELWKSWGREQEARGVVIKTKDLRSSKYQPFNEDTIILYSPLTPFTPSSLLVHPSFPAQNHKT